MAMAGFAATSPRVRDGRRATIGSFGTLLPRPGSSASATSPRVYTRTLRQASLPSGSATSPPPSASLTGSLSAGNWQGVIGMLTGGSSALSGPSSGKKQTNQLKKALDTRGGVVQERDGYEVFFGVTEAEGKAKVPDRDGFDIFYGIKNDDRITSVQSSRGDGDVFAAKDRDAHVRSRISQAAHPRRERRLSAPAQVGAPAAKFSAAPTSSKSVRAEVTATADVKAKPNVLKSKCIPKPVVPDSVPTFSLATPAPSFAPALVTSHHDEVADNVQLYSMATPCSSFVPPCQ